MKKLIIALVTIIAIITFFSYNFFFQPNTTRELEQIMSIFQSKGIETSELNFSGESLKYLSLTELNSLNQELKTASFRSSPAQEISSVYVLLLDSRIYWKELKEIENEIDSSTAGTCEILPLYEQASSKMKCIISANESYAEKNNEVIEKFPEEAEFMETKEEFFDASEIDVSTYDSLIATFKEVCAE